MRVQSLSRGPQTISECFDIALYKMSSAVTINTAMFDFSQGHSKSTTQPFLLRTASNLANPRRLKHRTVKHQEY